MKFVYTIQSAMLFAAAAIKGSVATGGIDAIRRANSEIERISGYRPNNDVSDQFDLDKDLTEMEALVLQNQLNHAKKLYMEGGFSMSYANITIVNATAHGKFRAGDSVHGKNTNGDSVFGKIKDTVSFSRGDNANVMVLYTKNEPSPTCAVGALHTFKAAVKTNCFAEKSTLHVNNVTFDYLYDIHTQNLNDLSLQKLALNASQEFDGLDDFEIFKKYYGTGDYADTWAMAAASPASTGFASGYGNADFALLQGRKGHGEGLLKGAAYLNVYMFVLGKLGLGVKYCNEGHIHRAEYALDEAVAFYTGSLADKSISDNGRFIYALADKRCQDFKTCGHSGADHNGTAYVNLKIMHTFKSMQDDYMKRNQSLCSDAAVNVKYISQLMRVPIIQSVLAYGYIREYSDDNSQDEVEKAEAKGATYAAAVLPYLNECSQKYAGLLYEYMRVGSDNKLVSYSHIRESFEECYKTLGVTCDMVGGIWDSARGQYSAQAAPCSGKAISSKSRTYGNGGGGGLSAGGVFGLTTALVLCGFLVIRFRKKLPFRRNKRENFDNMSSVNIAAVSEIS